MSISAMKQALDAITNVLAGGDFDNPYADLKEAASELRQAIAEAEKQEAVAWMWKDGTLTSDPDFADGTWTPLFTSPVHASDISQECVDETAKGEHEPVAWMHNFIEGTVITHEPADIGRHPDRWTPLYTAPPKREWIGLDPEMMRNTPIEFNRGALWAERWLKEKNT